MDVGTNFYNGLSNNLCTSVDTATSGSSIGKYLDYTNDLLEEMVNNGYQWLFEGAPTRQGAIGIHSIDAVMASSANMDSF